MNEEKYKKHIMNMVNKIHSLRYLDKILRMVEYYYVNDH